MKITIDGIEVFSRKYEVWDDLLEEYVDYETEHKRQVPDYDFNVMVEAIVRFFLELSTTLFITEAIGWRRRRIQGKLEEKRYSQLTDKLDKLIQATQASAEARPQESTLSEDAATASALRQWATEENVSIEIDLETEAEGDLWETFEAWTTGVPGASVRK
jgi:hypothetical protein